MFGTGGFMILIAMRLRHIFLHSLQFSMLLRLLVMLAVTRGRENVCLAANTRRKSSRSVSEKSVTRRLAHTGSVVRWFCLSVDAAKFNSPDSHGASISRSPAHPHSTSVVPDSSCATDRSIDRCGHQSRFRALSSYPPFCSCLARIYLARIHR